MGTKEKLAKKIYHKPFRKLCGDRKTIILKLSRLDDLEQKQYARVPKHAFIFSKLVIAFLLIFSLIFRMKWVVIISFILMVFYTLLSTKKNPSILFYTYTINKLFKSEDEMLDEKGVRFANSLGLIIIFICLIFLYFGNQMVGWIFVFIAASLKIAGASGFCTGLKLYHCMSDKSCCSFIKRK